MGKFIAIGDDGLRPVVWGMGDTEDAAIEDARVWLAEAVGTGKRLEREVEALTVRAANAKEVARVEAGDLEIK